MTTICLLSLPYPHFLPNSTFPLRLKTEIVHPVGVVEERILDNLNRLRLSKFLTLHRFRENLSTQ